MQKVWETRVCSLGQEDSPGGRHGHPLQASCLGQSRGQRSLAGYSPRGGKRRTRLSDSARTQVFSQATLSHCISSVVMASGGITGLYRTNRVGRITRDGGGTLLVQGREPCWRRKRRTPRWGAFLSAEEEPGVPRGLGGEGPTKTGA